MSASDQICPLLYATNSTKYVDNRKLAERLSKCKERDCMWYISTRDYPIEGMSRCAIVRLALK